MDEFKRDTIIGAALAALGILGWYYLIFVKLPLLPPKEPRPAQTHYHKTPGIEDRLTPGKLQVDKAEDYLALAQEYTQKADSSFEAGNKTVAAINLDQALRHHFNAASAYEKRGKTDESIEQYVRVISLYKRHKDTLADANHSSVFDDACIHVARLHRNKWYSVIYYLDALAFEGDKYKDALLEIVKIPNNSDTRDAIQRFEAFPKIITHAANEAAAEYLTSIVNKAFGEVDESAEGMPPTIYKDENNPYAIFLRWLGKDIPTKNYSKAVAHYFETIGLPKEMRQRVLDSIEKELTAYDRSGVSIREKILRAAQHHLATG